MPGRVSFIYMLRLLILLSIEHQLMRKMICCIVCHVRDAHTVVGYNTAHPYHTVKSPRFNKENKDRYGLGFVFRAVQVNFD